MRPLARARRPAVLVLSGDDGAGVAVRAVVRFHLRAFVREEAGARAGEVAAVHQLRVATRRLRATLQLFGPMVPTSLTRAVHDDLSWIADTIGAVRDLDVLTEEIASHARRLEAEARRALGPLTAALHDRRLAAHADLTVGLDSLRCRRLVARLTAFADSPAPARQTRLGDVAPELVLPMLRAVHHAGRRVTPTTAAAVLHRLRVRVKRLRYALESVEGLGGAGVRKCRRRLVDLQDVLGRLQDAATAIAFLQNYGETARVTPATLLAVGQLIHAFGRQARKARRKFPAEWARVDRRRLVDAVASELTKGRRRETRPASAEAS